MSVFWPLIVPGLVLISVGVYYLTASEEELWGRHERRVLAQGLMPKRTDSWLQSIRISSYFSLGMGLILILGGVIINRTEPVEMSNITIMGHHLTQAEWDECGRNASSCALVEAMRQQEEAKRRR